jgi:transcriptional regulator with XRE-family HTH domain
MGRTIKDVAASKGLSLRELSRRSGMMPGSVSKACGPDGNPTLETIRLLSKAMRMRTWALVRLLDTPLPRRAGEEAQD